MKPAYRGSAIFIVFFLLGAFTRCFAGDIRFDVCEQVSDSQLIGIYQNKLFPIEQEQGCQWSDQPDGRVYFQIAVIESQKHLREFFQKEMPPGTELNKINGLGDRCLLTVSEGYLAVIVIREGDWVLISTVNFLKIKPRSEKQERLWDIYRKILINLP